MKNIKKNRYLFLGIILIAISVVFRQDSGSLATVFLSVGVFFLIVGMAIRFGIIKKKGEQG